MSLSSASWTASDMDKEKQYISDRKKYGYIASLPIFVAIVHLFFTLFFMTVINFHEDTQLFSNLYTLGEMYSVSIFTALLIGLKPSLSIMKSLPGLFGVVMGLAMIFLSTSAVKGKKKAYFLSLGVYAIDSAFCFVDLILSLTLKGNVHLMVYDYIFMFVLHFLFLAIYVYGIFLIRRINSYEKEMLVKQNEIHIEKGNEE